MNTELTGHCREIKNRIREQIENGLFQQASELIKEYKDIVPNDPEVISFEAVVEIAFGRLDQAEILLQKGLAMEENNFDLLYNLAYVYQQRNEQKKSFDYYQQAINLAPTEGLKQEIGALMIQLVQEAAEYDWEKKQAKPPLVSIVVLAYNHLEHTKLCIESIYKYTKNVDFELITVNNGSSDGTREYFDSLPNMKKIHLKDNFGCVNGFVVGMQAAEGTYTACICNDFVFTINWLSNILNIIESDESIGYVSPGASNISNYQQIDGDYTSLEEMHEFAAKYNVSNFGKTEERVRLLPNVLLVRTKLLREIGYYDPRFIFGEFADDDISFKIRRAGYKLVFDRGTFVYHFGSVTTREAQIEKKSLSYSREIFVDKYGIDSWEDAGFCGYILEAVNYNRTEKEIRILGVNTACGGTPLQVKNKFIQLGKKVLVTNYLEDEKYLLDSKSVSDETIIGSLQDISQLPRESFDIIIVERGMQYCGNIKELLNDLKLLLAPLGQICFSIENESYFANIIRILSGNKINRSSLLVNSYINSVNLIELLQEVGLSGFRTLQCMNPMNETQKNIVSKLASMIDDPKQIETILSIQKYIISARKN